MILKQTIQYSEESIDYFGVCIIAYILLWSVFYQITIQIFFMLPEKIGKYFQYKL